MHYEQNCESLRKLKLTGFLQDYVAKHADPAYARLSQDEALAGHLCAQLNFNENRQYNRLLKNASLKYPHACPEDVDYTVDRGLVPSVIAFINTLAWVEKHQNVFFIGPTGTGKSYLACVEGHNCIRKGISVLSFRLSQFLEHIEICRADGSLARLRARLMKARVLIFDDWAISPITQQGRQDLLEVIEARTTTGSIIITSQLPVEKWHEWLGEPTIADAILDRLIHRAHVVKLKGESMRKLKESVGRKEVENV